MSLLIRLACMKDTEEAVEIEGMRRAVSAVDSADLVVLMSCVDEAFNPPIDPVC